MWLDRILFVHWLESEETEICKCYLEVTNTVSLINDMQWMLLSLAEREPLDETFSSRRYQPSSKLERAVSSRKCLNWSSRTMLIIHLEIASRPSWGPGSVILSGGQYCAEGPGNYRQIASLPVVRSRAKCILSRCRRMTDLLGSHNSLTGLLTLHIRLGQSMA